MLPRENLKSCKPSTTLLLFDSLTASCFGRGSSSAVVGSAREVKIILIFNLIEISFFCDKCARNSILFVKKILECV